MSRQAHNLESSVRLATRPPRSGNCGGGYGGPCPAAPQVAVQSTSEMGSKSHRMAIAGLHMMQGKSQAESLVEAGYSPSTARNPAAKGLGAAVCMQAAVEQFPAVDPSHLVEQARRVLGRKLDQLATASDQDIRHTPPREIARIFEVVEKAHGHRSGDGGRDLDPRSFAERVVWLQQLKLELDKLTGQNVGELPSPAAAVDVEVEKD